MRGKKAKLPEGFDAENFRKLAKREPNARVRLRLMGLAHLQESHSITETAEMCRVERSTIYD